MRKSQVEDEEGEEKKKDDVVKKESDRKVKKERGQMNMIRENKQMVGQVAKYQ